MAGTAYKLVFLVVGLLGAVLLLFQALYINDATTPSSRHSSGSVGLRGAQETKPNPAKAEGGLYTLRQHRPTVNNSTATNSSLPPWPKIHTKAYKQCYLHSGANAFAQSPANYVISDEYKFIYFEIPKVASTAIRTLMHKNVPDISPALNRLAWKLTPEQLGYFKFTCVRDPADRFVSNFNFLSVFDNALSADRDGSKEDVIVSMNQWLDRLATEGWWNWHLWPQSLYLSHFDGAPRAIDRVYDQTNLQAIADDLHSRVGTPKFQATKIAPLGGQYSESKKVNTHELPRETTVKICSVYLVDYCCFGFPLPQPCQEAGLNCSRDEEDILNVHWKNGQDTIGGKSHLYNSEAVALKQIKQSLGHE